jgi:hypothetical protein
LKANPGLLTAFIRLCFLAEYAEMTPAPVASILDILLPEVFRAYAIAKDSQNIIVSLSSTFVALTCIPPGSVQVKYLTATPAHIETYQLNENGKVVKV